MQKQGMEHFFSVLAPVLTLSLCILGPGETQFFTVQCIISIQIPLMLDVIPALLLGEEILLYFSLLLSPLLT